MIIDQFFGLRLLISYSINQAVIRRLEDKRCLKETYGKNHDSHQITRNPDSYMYMSCVRKKYIIDMQYYPMSDTIRHDTVRHVYVMFLVIINDIRHMCKHMYSNVRKELNMGIISEKKLSLSEEIKLLNFNIQI